MTLLISLLVQNSDRNVDHAVYCLRRVLIDVEKVYINRKLCFASYFSCVKLRYYMLLVMVEVLCKTDLKTNMLYGPMITWKIAKWSLVLLEFHLRYVS